jgi:hypothetical protein
MKTFLALAMWPLRAKTPDDRRAERVSHRGSFAGSPDMFLFVLPRG